MARRRAIGVDQYTLHGSGWTGHAGLAGGIEVVTLKTISAVVALVHDACDARDIFAIAATANVCDANPVGDGASGNVLVLPYRTGGVPFALSGGVAVAELSSGTCMAAGMGAVVPSESLSFGTVLGGTRSIRDHVVVLGIGTLFAISIWLLAVSSNAQIA